MTLLSIIILIVGVLFHVLLREQIIDFPYASVIPWVCYGVGTILIIISTREKVKVSSDKNEIDRQHLINLIRMAKADGKMTDAEKEYIKFIFEKRGYDYETFKELENAEDEEFIIPESDDEKNVQLHQLTLMLLVDGVINGYEKNIIKSVAKKFYKQIPNDKLDELVDKIILATLEQLREISEKTEKTEKTENANK